ncbi:MAG TPA: DinB family protein [Chitinophagales bacterium]|nr:DinB family protein [Chitinophagales bacterium]HNL84181.1 DinB family protein [Chitinophagales bacterium]
MMSKTGLDIPMEIKNPAEDTSITAAQLATAYTQAAATLLAEMEAKWTDASLQDSNNLYGMEWSNALTLSILLKHEIHHRGQLTVLMRLAGLIVPGVYGPSAEEWEQYGMKMEE